MVALFIVSSCNVNCYKEVTRKETKKEIKQKPSEWDIFIQGYTSNEASLWWHPLGRRVFFVRGEGAFELTDKVEPKEEAHV